MRSLTLDICYDGCMKKIAIIGGGAAGLVAALSAAEQCSGSDVQIVVYEGSDRIGKSILASGNGRCNFSNQSIDASMYHNKDFVSESLQACPPEEVWAFFEDIGLLWHEEQGGRLYPVTNKASSVLDVLRFALAAARVEIRCNHVVSSVMPDKHGHFVVCEHHEAEFYDAVILAGGGDVDPSTLPTSYAFHTPQALLGPLATETAPIKGLNNVKINCELSLGNVFKERGELLFREYGISGILVFNCSRFARAGNSLNIDLFPDLSNKELDALLKQRFAKLQARTRIEFFAGMLQPPIARAFSRRAGLRPDDMIQREDLESLGKWCKDFPLKVKGLQNARQAQVRRGNFSVSSFNPRTLASREDESIFVVGEALDVDGPCGGYNLHWAWTSGILAGRAAAQVLAKAESLRT